MNANHYENVATLAALKTLEAKDRRLLNHYHNEIVLTVSEVTTPSGNPRILVIFHRNMGTWSAQGIRTLTLDMTPGLESPAWTVSNETWLPLPGPRPGDHDGSYGPAVPTTTYRSSAHPTR